MKRSHEIEAVLERSLRKQVNVRRLDASFDAAVWARIGAEESHAAARVPARPAVASKAARWMFIVNVAGIACVAAFLCVFAFQWFAGVQAELTVPDLSSLMSERDATNWSTGIAVASMLFGFLYTPWGRRLRDELF